MAAWRSNPRVFAFVREWKHPWEDELTAQGRNNGPYQPSKSCTHIEIFVTTYDTACLWEIYKYQPGRALANSTISCGWSHVTEEFHLKLAPSEQSSASRVKSPNMEFMPGQKLLFHLYGVVRSVRVSAVPTLIPRRSSARANCVLTP